MTKSCKRKQPAKKLATALNDKSQKKNKKFLESLIGIAATLPGIVTSAQAQKAIATSPKVDAFYSRYSENHFKYKVDSYATNLLFPLSSNWEFELGALREAMTGASVSIYLPNTLVNPIHQGSLIPGTSPVPALTLVEALTGPSIVETRSQVSGRANYYLPDGRYSLEGGYSTENDFESFFGILNSEWYFNKKNTVLFAGFGYAYNISRPSQRDLNYAYALFNGTNLVGNRGKYNTERFNLGIKQDINKNFYVQQNVELIFNNGDLFDPYKSIAWVGPNTLNWPNTINFGPVFTGSDRRPHRKITGAFVTSLVHYIPCFDSALHFNYRYAANTWNIHSNTFQLAYYQPFWKSWEISPKVRYYTQDRASFYALSFYTEPSPLFPYAKKLRQNRASSDYRLSNFGSIGYDITLSKFFQSPNIKLSATFGFAKNAVSYGWTKNKGPKNPSNNFHEKYIAVNLASDFPQNLSYKKKEKCGSIYKEGEISIQPLIISFTGLTFGRKHEDTKFTPVASPTPAFLPVSKFNMYRNQRGYGFNDIHRNGLGYDFQLGYFFQDNMEVFTDLGFVNEKSIKEPGVVNPLCFKFKERTTYRTNFGARYYIDIKTIFTPFIGFMGGVEWQPKTKANVFGYNPFDVTQFLIPGPKLGTFEIFKTANLFNGALLTGLDYRFNETFAVSLATGLYYYQRNKAKTLRIPGQVPLKISDNKNKFIVPVSISLKIIM